MVAMRLVVIRRKHGREEAAGAVADVAQESGFRPAAVPVFEHRHSPPVGQVEADDVDRVGGGMLAEPAFRPVVEAATAVASGVQDPPDRLSEMPLRSRLGDARFEQVKRRRHRAADDDA